MGVPHLEKLRDFLESNAEKAYSRTELRDTLKQNFGTVKQNLKYLIEKEGTVERKEDTDKELYQWKNVKIHENKSEETQSNS